MFEKRDSSNRKKWMVVASFSISARFTAKLQHRKTLFLRGFILKPTERGKVLLKIGPRDF